MHHAPKKLHSIGCSHPLATNISIFRCDNLGGQINPRLNDVGEYICRDGIKTIQHFAVVLDTQNTTLRPFLM